MNDGRINHEACLREKLQTCDEVIERTQPYRQNRSEQGDAYFISLRMTMLAHPKTIVFFNKEKRYDFFWLETKALLFYLTMLSLKRSRERLIRSLRYRGRWKLPEPSSNLVLDGFTTSGKDEPNGSEDLLPRKYKVLACKKKTFKERSKKKVTV